MKYIHNNYQHLLKLCLNFIISRNVNHLHECFCSLFPRSLLQFTTSTWGSNVFMLCINHISLSVAQKGLYSVVNDFLIHCVKHPSSFKKSSPMLSWISHQCLSGSIIHHVCSTCVCWRRKDVRIKHDGLCPRLIETKAAKRLDLELKRNYSWTIVPTYQATTVFENKEAHR